MASVAGVAAEGDAAESDTVMVMRDRARFRLRGEAARRGFEAKEATARPGVVVAVVGRPEGTADRGERGGGDFAGA